MKFTLSVRSFQVPDTPSTPVFLVTGFGVELSAEERRAHGVEGVLVKPLKIADLLNAVAQAARKRSQAR